MAASPTAGANTDMSAPINTRLTLGQALESAQIKDPSGVRQFVGGNFVSPDEIVAMREWVGDCAVELCKSDDDASENLAWVAAATDLQILRYVSRNYSGGIPAFIQAGPVEA